MKAKIHIHGHVGSSNAILMQLSAYNEKKKSFPGQISLYYASVKDARQDIKEAFNKLKADEPDFYKNGWISLCKDELTYDAAKAEIIKV